MVYDKKQKGMSEKIFCNYGDNIQTIALDYIIKQLFPEKEIVDINIYDLPYYDGEYVLLPLNCNFWTCDENYFLPASYKIIPVFIAVSFQIPPTSKRAIDYLKKWEPIGCRDFETLDMMRRLGIQAYLNGCTTLTLPKRNKSPIKKKVFLVGLSESSREQVLQKIGNDNVEVVNQIEIYCNDVEGSSFITDYKTKEIYQRYRDEATLIITSKLHCASPCIAMGIPVIIIREKKSCRFEWINKLIHIYTLEEIESINWKPDIIEIESLKNKMKKLISERIMESYLKYKDRAEVSDYFEECEHEEALSVSEQIISAVKSSRKTKYIIWGVGGYLGNAIYHILLEACPDVILIAAVDQYKSCEFHGIQTVKANAIKHFPDAFVIVTTATGESEAIQYMNNLGRKSGEDYFTFSMIS